VTRRGATESWADPTGPWRGWEPGDLAAALRAGADSWWVAGGWALDLFLGGRSRTHRDLDLSCFRSDFDAFRSALSGWEFYAASNGQLSLVAPDSNVPSEVHGIWCRPSGDRTWHFEILLEDRQGSDWCFRRDPSIRLPIDRLYWFSDEGVKVLRPEIQLLYKAKDVRPHDQADFDRVVPLLDRLDLSWLETALARVYPGHAWLTVLESIGDETEVASDNTFEARRDVREQQ
jgi:hypothetical protein